MHIQVEGLVKRYGARVALAGVSFAVGPGEVVGLLGPNGAGKSTTLSILATLLPFDAGTVTVGGRRLPAESASIRRTLGFVPQQLALYPPLTATENLRFFGRALGLGARTEEAAREALAAVGLTDRADEPVERFSIGMQRRLNLACGILHRPEVVLMDEPAVGVDPQSRERVFAAVESLGRGGTAVLYSTHHMEEAERLCSRVVLLDAGRVRAEGTSAALLAASGITPRVSLRTTRPLPDGWLAGVPAAHLVEGPDGSTLVAVRDSTAVPAVLAAAGRAGGEVLEFALTRPNLADAFFAFTGHALRDEEAGV